jgi:hypothetical protein
MKTQSIDTNVKAEKFLISLIKKSTPAQKFLQICSLSQTTIQLSKRAIARANENLSELKLNLLFVKYHYGENLANNLEKYIKDKNYHAKS